MAGHYVMSDAKRFKIGQAHEQEVADFGATWTEINWGVWYDDELAALFQAEPLGNGWLNVHATVKRRTLHPEITKLHAKAFSNRLLELGATGLQAEIELKNRAAIRMAKAAGYSEISRNDEWVTLVRKPDGQEETATATV